MRPPLNREIQIKDFLDFYWLKEELQHFCRENGLSSAGSKTEITSRIEVFLQTGEIQKPQRKIATKSTTARELSLKTVITEGHKCSQNVRIFFKAHIPNFHFSTYIQNYFKANVGKTYQDVINAWHEEQQRLRDPSYTKNIAPQFEYNQFIRDFFSDPSNQHKNRTDAIAAWNIIKSQPGDNKYKPQ